MLDFHYSDTWVDATHIQAPAAWQGASDAAMADSVAKYTRRVLDTLNAAGATPDLVQVGNEIMYGLCGIKVHPYQQSGDNWDGYLALLNAGCNAVREKCPNAQIIIHTDRPTNIGYNNFYYNKLVNGGVDFDIIGLSYYPFWHGYLTAAKVASQKDKNNLVAAINNLNTVFPTKRVHIVECAYNFQWWPSSGVNYDTRDAWPCTVAGQYAFVKDLVDALKPLTNVDGINYWFPEEAGNGDDTNWSSGSKGTVILSWQNRGFWKEDKSTSGHAINKTAAVSDTKTAADVCAPYYLGTFVEHQEQGLNQTPFPLQDGQGEAHKLLRNGQLIIRVGNREYNASGMLLK
jgi:arabinogalactan endo-1,4-beta-galactosidase